MDTNKLQPVSTAAQTTYYTFTFCASFEDGTPRYFRDMFGSDLASVVGDLEEAYGLKLTVERIDKMEKTDG